MKKYIKPELLVDELYSKKILIELDDITRSKASDTDLDVGGELPL